MLLHALAALCAVLLPMAVADSYVKPDSVVSPQQQQQQQGGGDGPAGSQEARLSKAARLAGRHVSIRCQGQGQGQSQGQEWGDADSDADGDGAENEPLSGRYVMAQVLHACGGVATGYVLACTSHAHAYLLADNRHYVFYIWQRILSNSSYRMLVGNLYYLLVQFVGSWMCRRSKRSSTNTKQKHGRGYGHGYEYCAGGVGPVALFGFLATAAATLVPSPLLEPRYFSPVVLLGLLHSPALLCSGSGSGCTRVANMSAPPATATAATAAVSPSFASAAAATALIPACPNPPGPSVATACNPSQPLLFRSGSACVAAVCTVAVLACCDVLLMYVFLRRPFLWADGSVARFLF